MQDYCYKEDMPLSQTYIKIISLYLKSRNDIISKGFTIFKMDLEMIIRHAEKLVNAPSNFNKCPRKLPKISLKMRLDMRQCHVFFSHCLDLPFLNVQV